MTRSLALFAILIATAPAAAAQVAPQNGVPVLPAQADDPNAPIPPKVGSIKPVMRTLMTPSNPLATAVPVLDLPIVEPGAAFTQLGLDRVSLPKGCWIELTSLEDGAKQKLDTTDFVQGRGESAFFNGPGVRLRVFLGPKAAPAKLRIRDLAYSVPAAMPESLCGADSRRVSTNQAIGRLLFRRGRGLYVCSAVLVSRSNGFATAGHCLSGATSATVQFRVPRSRRNGAMRHPSPRDQYGWQSATRRYSNRGPGNDWGVFRTYGNPFARQRSYFRPTHPNARRSFVYVNGYGSARGNANFRLRYDRGYISAVLGNQVRYPLDTTGGTSGGAVYDPYWRLFAIHSHGYCHTGVRANIGTSVARGDFAYWLRWIGR